ncbi:hypothetical protein ACFVYV_26795 [Streptomyces mirabilis]|uniref:hypothetical protein n=1 Tax=Streptomyces mirabilis TaxID=68239 RepID=UPI0036DF8216
MNIRRETAADDCARAVGLMAALGDSLDPDREPDEFELIIACALYANWCDQPPAGHTYPRRG